MRESCHHGASYPENPWDSLGCLRESREFQGKWLKTDASDHFKLLSPEIRKGIPMVPKVPLAILKASSEDPLFLALGRQFEMVACIGFGPSRPKTDASDHFKLLNPEFRKGIPMLPKVPLEFLFLCRDS